MLDTIDISLPGYGLDRAVAHLARHGEAEIEQARSIAAADGVDPGLVDRLWRVNSATTRAVVVDATRHEIRAGAQILPLTRKRTVRRILYCLAEQPGRVVSRDDLARSLWKRDYDPLVHEGALKSNISNLRKLVTEVHLTVECQPPGYRLVVPEQFRFERT